MLAIVLLSTDEYEVTIDHNVLHRLKEQFDVNQNYDPLRPSKELIEEYGNEAEDIPKKSFLERAGDLPARVQVFYEDLLHTHA